MGLRLGIPRKVKSAGRNAGGTGEPAGTPFANTQGKSAVWGPVLRFISLLRRCGLRLGRSDLGSLLWSRLLRNLGRTSCARRSFRRLLIEREVVRWSRRSDRRGLPSSELRRICDHVPRKCCSRLRLLSTRFSYPAG